MDPSAPRYLSMLERLMNYAIRFFQRPIFTPIAWGLISGLLMGTSYIPFYPWAVAFAFAPLWIYWIKSRSAGSIFVSGAVAGFTLNLVGFHWIAETAVEFGRLPKAASYVVLLGFCLVFALHIALAGLVWRKMFEGRTELTSVLGLAALTFLGETFFPMIFPWNLGYTWLMAPGEGAQWAEVIGFRGLSFWTWGVNALATWTWVQYKNSIRHWLIPVGAILLPSLTGFLLKPKLPDNILRVMPVQADIGNPEKLDAQSFYEVRLPILETHLRLTKAGVEQAGSARPDLIVWPETAIPERFDPEFLRGDYQQKSLSPARDLQIPLIFGAYSQDPDRRFEYNAVFTADRTGQVLDKYRKTYLLAFGETFPGADMFPILREWIPTISEFGRGTGPTVLELEGRRYGIQICYEGLFPEFTRELVAKKAQVLLNVTNDSWFGTHFEPHQHLLMTAARAIESRRPLIRSTNTGITTVAQLDGTLGEYSPQNREWTGIFEVAVPQEDRTTFYMRFGGWLEWACMMLVGLLRMLSLRNQRPN